MNFGAEQVDGPAAARRPEDAADQPAGEHQRDRGRLEIRRSRRRPRRSGSTGRRRCRRPTPGCRSTAARSSAPRSPPRRSARRRCPTACRVVSPRWRPTRFMCSDAGMVPMAPPSTQQVTGRVARPDVGRERQPRQAVDRDQRRVVREQQRLARGEQTDVALAYCSYIQYRGGQARPPLSSGSALFRAGPFRKRRARGVRRRLDARRTRHSAS